jgi:hypothetical protein
MSITIPTTLTGASQTGFTSPTYTTVSDTPPDSNSKQNAVTALGGTQTGVDAHSVSQPFTLTVSRPKTFAVLGKPNPVTGLIANVPRNKYKVITRKGVLPLADQPYQTMIIRTEIEVPAGSDTADAANIRAALSAHFGLVWDQSSGLGDTNIDGVL